MKGRKLDSNQWFGAEGRNKHSTRTVEETRIQKNEESLKNLQDIFKCSTIWIIGVPEGEEEEQEFENLFEQIMKNFVPNLAKEIDFQEVQEAKRAQEVHTKAHHNYFSQD